MRSFILAAAVVALVSASGSESYSRDRPSSRPSSGKSFGSGSGPSEGYGGSSYGPSGGYGRGGGSGYGGSGGYSGGGGYGGSGGGYGKSSYGNTGYGNGGGYYQPAPPPPKPADRLDALDKLNSRVIALLDEVKTFSEILTALEARQSAQKRIFDSIVILTLNALENTDDNQDNIFDELEDALDEVMDQINNHVRPLVDSLEYQNDENLKELEDVEKIFIQEQTVDIEQSGDIAELVALARDFKSRLFQIKQNEFELFSDEVEGSNQALSIVTADAEGQICEVGEITLDDDECTGSIDFQNDFGGRVPQVVYGLKGANFDVNALEDKPAGYGYGYGGGYGPKDIEPATIGFYIIGYATPNKVDMELLFKEFGETRIKGATVSFQACSIGPGLGPVDH